MCIKLFLIINNSFKVFNIFYLFKIYYFEYKFNIFWFLIVLSKMVFFKYMNIVNYWFMKIILNNSIKSILVIYCLYFLLIVEK